MDSRKQNDGYLVGYNTAQDGYRKGGGINPSADQLDTLARFGANYKKVPDAEREEWMKSFKVGFSEGLNDIKSK